MKSNPVVHFGMPAEDRKRMSDFYTSVFGWQAKQLGPEMGNYVLVNTAETDENNMVKTPGNINGGFFQKTEENSVPMVTIMVEDIKEAIENVKAAGGTIVGKIEDMPNLAFFVNFRDTEGNLVSLMQPHHR